MALKIGEEQQVQMPMKTVASLIAIVAVGVWGYFGIVEKLNQHATKLELMSSDLEKNTEFRIKWPRGEMGTLPADSEQYMLIEFMSEQVEAMQTEMESMMSNTVNINFLKDQVSKLQGDVEKLKDKVRQNGTSH